MAAISAHFTVKEILAAVLGCIATKQNLLNRRVGTDGLCPRCKTEPETTNHLLFSCPLARPVWALSDPLCFPTEALYTNLDFLFWRVKAEDMERECKALFGAKKKPDQEEPPAATPNILAHVVSDAGANYVKCRTDAAWKETDPTLDGLNHSINVRLKGTRTCLSATHAELMGFVWAMQCIIVMSSCDFFETDSKELISIVKPPDDWPIYHAEFADFCLA